MLNRANVNAGDEVFITGASGGVGTGLVQLARRRGAHVSGLTTSEKANWVQEIGADEVIPRDEADVTTAIERRTGDSLVAVVADVVGGRHVQSFLEFLRQSGRFVTAGAVAGPFRNRPTDSVPETARHRRVNDGDAERVPGPGHLYQVRRDPASTRGNIPTVRGSGGTTTLHSQRLRRQYRRGPVDLLGSEAVRNPPA